MFIPASFLCWTTQSMAAITCETSAAPRAFATLTLTIRASGATPRKLWWSELFPTGTAPASLPAMIPAMCVPCPKVSR